MFLSILLILQPQQYPILSKLLNQIQNLYLQNLKIIYSYTTKVDLNFNLNSFLLKIYKITNTKIKKLINKQESSLQQILFYLINYPKMKQTFVNNVQQLMTANQNQRIKIGYLQSQKQKRQQYLAGLRQSIALNKQTLIVLNEEGPNVEAIQTTSKQNLHLIKLDQELYNQNRRLNALLLMEQQLRVEEKSFYLERINQFQTRISDLRKYLHDKEQSFSTVVARLKKYEEWNEKPLAQKVQDTEGLRKLTNQIVTKIMAQKNMYKIKFQETFANSHRYQILKDTLKNPMNYARFISEIKKNEESIKALQDFDIPKKSLVELQLLQNKKQPQSKSSISSQIKPSQINKQLMRLFKKQKLNNQILQSALHNAIQKNQQLLKINQNYELALGILQKKMQKLIAQNNFLRHKQRQFNSNSYGKKYSYNRTKDQLDEPSYIDLFKLTYEIKDQQNQQVSSQIYKNLLKQSLKQDIEKTLLIPLNSSEKPPRYHRHSHSRKMCQQEEKMNDMTTNDITHIKQQINWQHISSQVQKQEKQYIRQNKQKDHHEYQKNQKNGKRASIRQSQEHLTLMIKSASQPRILFQWEEVNVEEMDAEQDQMIVQEF